MDMGDGNSSFAARGESPNGSPFLGSNNTIAHNIIIGTHQTPLHSRSGAWHDFKIRYKQLATMAVLGGTVAVEVVGVEEHVRSRSSDLSRRR